MSFITKAIDLTTNTLATLAESSKDSATHLVDWAEKSCENPIFIVIGNNVSVYRKAKVEHIIVLSDVSKVADMLVSLPKEIEAHNIDGIVLDDVAVLRSLWNAHVAINDPKNVDGQTTQRHYGIVNNHITSLLASLSAMTPNFACSIAVVADEETDELSIGLSEKYTNVALAFFDQVNYVLGKTVTKTEKVVDPETGKTVSNKNRTYKLVVQTDREKAIALQLPRTTRSRK